jgi:hypothetical protein
MSSQNILHHSFITMSNPEYRYNLYINHTKGFQTTSVVVTALQATFC